MLCKIVLLLVTIQTINCNVIAGGVQCGRYGTKCVPEMILVAKIKSLIVNKNKLKKKKTVEHECQHF